MKVDYIESAGFPAIAWCAVMKGGEISIIHGSGVEIFDGGFTDGAWDAPFTAEGLSSASVICGSAALIEENGIRFFSSSDRLCPLFSLRSGGRVYVSNSPSCLLTAAGKQVDMAYPFHLYDLVRIWRKGLFSMSGKMRISFRDYFNVHFSTILSVTAGGVMKTTRPGAGVCPADYAAYYQVLQSGVSRVLENASSALRKKSLGSIVALSKGYDTNANAALASRAGCREAFTFYDPSRADPNADNGVAHAEFFHLQCKEVSRAACFEVEHFNAQEFSFMHVGSQAALAGLEEDLKGKVFICGNNGELAWRPEYAQCGNDRTEAAARFISGIGQLEFRLRVGYVVFSPACIGMEHNRQLAKISGSEEMKPWDIGGDYNRPLARRLAEDAGLPREMFGQVKLAAGHQHFYREKDFPITTYADYQKFMKRRKAATNRLTNAYWRLRVRLLYSTWKVFARAEGPPRPLASWQCRFVMWHHVHPTKLKWDMLFIFMWGMLSLQERYREPLEKLM